jgi:hypothetical protein
MITSFHDSTEDAAFRAFTINFLIDHDWTIYLCRYVADSPVLTKKPKEL